MKNLLKKESKIDTFETVTLRTSGMRDMTVYEIAADGDTAQISQYAVGFCDGEEVRTLQKRAVCGIATALQLLNDCRLLSWDGFYGKHPKGVKDGTMFTLKATVNDNRKIYATGSQNFPRHYRDLTDGLYQLLREEKSE